MKGYQQISNWTNTNSGSSEWCFARKGGQEWFIKRFLSPVYPDAAINMPLALRHKKEERFNLFYKKKERLHHAIVQIPNGNLVVVKEIFRDGNHLYLSSDRIQKDGMSFSDASLLPEASKLSIMKSLINSMRDLHLMKVVHADIRPENILLKPTFSTYYSAKIIDFDNGFLVEEPPINPEQFSLDPVYAPPESIRFSMGMPVVLDRKIDIFSLGLIIHLILSGSLPLFDRERYKYLSAALNAGEALRLAEGLPASWSKTLAQMLQAKPEDRPSIEEIHQEHLVLTPPPPQKAQPPAVDAKKGWRVAPSDLSASW